MSRLSDLAGWVDVSVPVRSDMPVWPHQDPVRIERLYDHERHGVQVTRLSLTAHTGTHVDAPVHFVEGGAAVEAMPFEAMAGPARIVAVDDEEAIRPEHLEGVDLGEGDRVLFKTRNSETLWSRPAFEERFVYLTTEAARELARRGVRTVGIDYLGIGGYGKNEEAVHDVLLGGGAWVVEGLDLSAVGPGEVDLLCLPIKLTGADGAPARAFVRPRDGGAALHRTD